MSYRIVEHSSDNGKHYTIQKSWFFWWSTVEWWESGYDFKCSTLYSIKDAEDKIKQIEKADKEWNNYRKSKKQKVVKYVD